MSWWRRHAEGAVAVAPSLLDADFADLRSEIASLEAAGADLLHLDVMDGHFVPNLTFGALVAAAVRRCTELPLDAHLMISRPDRYLEAFARSGVDAVTIHVEAEVEIDSTLTAIGERRLRRGISLNPDTDLARLEPFLDRVDLVLVMAVQPGFGGQAFRDGALEKISELAGLRREKEYRYEISVDGGVDDHTGTACRRAGADILVSGSYLLRSADRAAAIASLRGG